MACSVELQKSGSPLAVFTKHSFGRPRGSESSTVRSSSGEGRTMVRGSGKRPPLVARMVGCVAGMRQIVAHVARGPAVVRGPIGRATRPRDRRAGAAPGVVAVPHGVRAVAMGSPSPSRVADRARPVTDEGSPTEGGRVTRLLEAVDGFQQRHVVLALPFAVQKKYGEDKGGVLTTNLAFAMFTTAFPLLLVLVTVLDLVLAGNPSARAQVLHTAYGQFPIVGKTLAADIHPLQRSSIVGLVVGLAALLYGATSLAGSGQYVMAQVWELAPADQ